MVGLGRAPEDVEVWIPRRGEWRIGKSEWMCLRYWTSPYFRLMLLTSLRRCGGDDGD